MANTASETSGCTVKQKQAWFSSLTGNKTVAGIDAGHPPEVTHFLTQIIQDAALYATGVAKLCAHTTQCHLPRPYSHSPVFFSG